MHLGMSIQLLPAPGTPCFAVGKGKRRLFYFILLVVSRLICYTYNLGDQCRTEQEHPSWLFELESNIARNYSFYKLSSFHLTRIIFTVVIRSRGTVL